MVIIGTERADRLPLVHSLYSTALLLAQHQVPPDLLYVFGSRLFLHTHTHTYTCTNSLYFCYTAASGAENKKSRFVLACFLPLLPLSSVFSPSLSFLLLLPYHPYLVSFFPPHSSLSVVASLSSPPMRCCDAASNRHQRCVLRALFTALYNTRLFGSEHTTRSESVYFLKHVKL